MPPPLIPTLLLILLSLFGFYTTWYLLYTNGTVQHMQALHSSYDGTHYLPGTLAPVRSTYTGIPVVDSQLAVLVVFFWSVVDGSRPEASLFGYHFAGQAFVMWALLVIESLRGGKGRIEGVVLVVWGMAVQMLAYAVIIPWYFIVHLSTSPTLDSLALKHYLIDEVDALSVVLAMIIGFVVPTVQMVLPAPSVLSYDAKQGLIAFWQFFPLYVGVAQMIISSAIRSFRGADGKGKEAAQKSIWSMRLLYGFLMLCGARDQLSTIHFVALAHAFPALFIPEFRGVWNIWNVFVQKGITPAEKMDSVGSGAFMLLQYDENIGNVALILWAFVMFLGARRATAQSWDWIGVTILGVVIAFFTGTIGLATALVWARDEMVFAHTAKKEEKKVK